MKYRPLDRLKVKIETAKEESDLTYFFELLNYAEFLTKNIALFLVSAINDDAERTRYRYQYKLSRANAIGDFSKSIDEVVIGPAAQLLNSNIRDYELKELTQRCGSGEWQYDCQLLISQCLSDFNIEHNKLSNKSPLRNWFLLLTQLRNKTKGHGAPRLDSCNKACPKLDKSISLIIKKFSMFKRSWAFLHQNLSGRYRVSYLTENVDDPYADLKKENQFNFSNGIYVYLDEPKKVDLFYSNAELTDFWITNGNLKNERFETLSYISDERVYQSANNYLVPITQLPKSHTEGTNDLNVVGNCLSNLPTTPELYVKRKDLEDELRTTLLQEDRFPIITLLGKGGVGKTSLAINLIYSLTNEKRFDLIIWFSSRDIDLLMDGPKQVQTKVLNIRDMAKDYCSLLYPKAKNSEQEQLFANDLTKNSFGKTLFIFDNFETISNPIEVFEWINTYIRNPNKVLITSRISRSFKADYPIEVQGMTEEECLELIHQFAKDLNIEGLLNNSYIKDLIEESDGHPYIIKILLGEVARNKKTGKIKRIVAEQEKILDALFKRTFNTLSPAAKRVFLTLCSWNSMVPTIALEAVLWRPENEKMNVQSAIEELRQSSFIEIITKDDDEIINVPLAATIFGKGELEINPEKIKIMSDRELLMEFGTTTFSNLSSGLSLQIERKFKSISKRINSITEFENELPLLEYIASKYPKTYNYIIELFEEYNKYDRVKYYIREYIKSNIPSEQKAKLWNKLASVCRYSKDWDGESHALTELVQIAGVSLGEISEAANRINNHIYNSMAAKRDEYKAEMLKIIIDQFTHHIPEGDATDYSRLGWLLLNNNDPVNAKIIVEKGLVIDNDNRYCQKLLEKLK
ncbi:hypothetical protein IMCC3317_04080 [Kordia antarctica]|uniref:NB-ARC domain-containing protein n=1 Tax=Kordia antarctica TaxID=1218801 RepID=A0A7L4ZE65_9FLAO|nr:NB-ARC domain-containing protein [Kordia antarctica]QHI35062.1 hypothetical protein IMCC3317_04080 [Kordia antarctica]